MAASAKTIRKYYLDRVNVHKREGESEEEAHKMAEQETKAKYGHLPKEGSW